MADDSSNYDGSGGNDDGGLAEREAALKRKMQSYTAPKQFMDDVPMEEAGGEGNDGGDPFASRGPQRVVDRESDYHRRRLARALSPTRGDAFSADAATKKGKGKAKKEEGGESSSYADVMRAAALARERDNTLINIRAKERAKEAAEAAAAAASAAAAAASGDDDEEGKPAKKPRTSEWDDDEGGGAAARAAAPPPPRGSLPAGAPSAWDATPVAPSASVSAAAAASASRRARSRWDETPVGVVAGATPAATANFFGATPVVGGGAFGATPVISFAGVPSAAASGAAPSSSITAEQFHALKVEQDLGGRNRPWTSEELDSLLPGPGDGYKVFDPPATYVPIMTPARKLSSSAPAPLAGAQTGFFMSDQQAVGGAGSASAAAAAVGIDLLPSIEGLPELRPEDAQYFGKLLAEVDEDELTLEEAKERRIMKLLLKVKNGTPQQRKSALRTLGDKAREFGAGPLFNQILPLLMSPALDDQERHVLVKVVDRVLRKLDELVRPYVHKVLVVVEPLLIDEDYYARIEGREIIANLAKAAGLATMIAAMRPDIDAVDEYVRNTTARAFAVVASALGVPALLPFLKAVCRSRKSWQARHTGVKIVQQTAILLGCGVLPHLGSLVAVVAGGLADAGAPKVRTMAGLALAALAEAAAPYGIDAFDDVLEPLWKGVRLLRGKALAAYLKAIGNIIPLMDSTYANYYTREVMVVLLREFASPDDEMKRIVLKVVAQCVGAEGVPASYVREEVLPGFFEHFWVRRMALDRRAYKAVLETTVEVARKVGGACVLSRIVEDLKDDAEPYRRLVMDAIRKILREQGAADVDARLEELLVDGALYAYQEQGDDDGAGSADDAKAASASSKIILDGFGAIVSSLGQRAKPYLAQVCGTIKWRLNNRAPKIRAQAADLVAAVAPTMASCGDDKLLSHLGVVLFEYLGEEFPDVLASILGALGAIVAVVYSSGGCGGIDSASVAERMQPPVRDLLPRLTPILKNRHERVQENCVDLVGRIADRAAEGVPAREWMRVCFELLELLKAQKLAVRRAAVSTFGFIARAIGPQDVLVALLNNLKVQERQMRVCTTVAIAVVAEACGPFTVLPALMNEYRTPENNVQNGVLKATSFLFEYVGRAGGDYVDAITPLLADALADRDAVHRQTAAAALGHVALGVAGLGREDSLIHLLNLLWPNIFEAAPHVARAVSFAVEALRLALGPGVMLEYLLQGLFHPARRVRETYWRFYNSLYVGSAGALVAFYPQLDAIGPQDAEKKKKKKTEGEGDDDDDDEEEEEEEEGGEEDDELEGTLDAPDFSAPSYRRTVLDVFI